MREDNVRLGGALAIIGGLLSAVCILVSMGMRSAGGAGGSVTDLFFSNYGMHLGFALGFIGLGFAFWGLLNPPRPAVAVLPGAVPAPARPWGP